jgi:hypothetical protein
MRSTHAVRPSTSRAGRGTPRDAPGARPWQNHGRHDTGRAGRGPRTPLGNQRTGTRATLPWAGSKASTTPMPSDARSVLRHSMDRHPAVRKDAWGTLSFPRCQRWWAPVVGPRSLCGARGRPPGESPTPAFRAQHAWAPSEGGFRQEQVSPSTLRNRVQEHTAGGCVRPRDDDATPTRPGAGRGPGGPHTPPTREHGTTRTHAREPAAQQTCDPVADYRCFNSSNDSIRPWSWNYRSCWHQTCPPVDTHHCFWIASIPSPTRP